MPNFEDLSGKKYGFLTIMYRAEDYIQPSGQRKRMWHCICDCGNECDVRASDIKSGNTTSCGCQSSRKKSVGIDDLTGKKYGDFVVISRAANKITPSGQQTRVWHCKCVNCGIEKDIQATQLKHFSGKCKCHVKEKRDLTGQNFGNLVVEKFDKTTNNRRYWICICNCGKENISVEEYRLLSGRKTSCGCLNKKKFDKSNKDTSANYGVLNLNKKKSDSSNKEKIIASNQSLLQVNPKLTSEWHPTKNGFLKPNEIESNSKIKVWWVGKCGHEWEATIVSRNRGSGCPICSSRQVKQGYNDLATVYPELLIEWDYEKNEVLPEKISFKSSKKVWWKCSKNHSYDMRIESRTGKQKCGCPFCCVPAKRILKGFNDLATTHPHLLSEWDFEKNMLSPEEVLSGSAKKVWWECKKGHSFQQSIVYKAKSSLESTCPYCSHQKLLVGFNDLATTHSYILDEWDYEKNVILPTQVGVGTHKKIWWRCPFGHSYQAYPSNRCGKSHSGCPICDKENHTSFPEQAILYYVKKYFSDAINSDREQIGMELDIYIPQLKIAIEYDGKNWHKNNGKYELKKNRMCKEKGILLIRIREEGLELYDDCLCLVRKETQLNESLTATIIELMKVLKINNINVDVDRDATLIYSAYVNTRKAKNLSSVYPQIASEWHPTKNGQLKATMVAPSANKKVWWLGSCGHTYQMGIDKRTYQKCGCPYCSGKKVLKGVNDLETWCNKNNSDLLEEWDYDLNSVLPSEVTKSSDKMIYWRCKKCSNVWKTKIDSRTRMKSGCPKCASCYRNVKPVINLDTNKIYESMIAAEKELHINRTSIGNVCRGKQKKAGGYRWAYYEE